jgi:hypothetical protein
VTPLAVPALGVWGILAIAALLSAVGWRRLRA